MNAMAVSATVLGTVVDSGDEARAERWVVVDGQGGEAQIARPDDLFDSKVGIGRYWIDPDSSAFGEDGDPTPRGRVKVCFNGICFEIRR